jgi:hypothetical protein
VLFRSPKSKELWGTLFADLHKRLAGRGYEGAMMLGLSSDVQPGKGDVAFLKEVSGNLPWVTQSHGGSSVGIKSPTVQYSSDGLGGGARVSYATDVWDLKYNNRPFKDHLYGWKLPYLLAQHDRFAFYNIFPPATLRCEAEFNITGAQRGIGRIGADYWHCVRDKRGARSALVPARYVESQWRNLDLGAAIFSPGPDGAVASARSENLREGVQECEARIFIEQALTTEALKAKLGSDLAQRAQDILDLRLQCNWTGTSSLQLTGREMEYATELSMDGMWRWHPASAGPSWFLASGWQDRDEKLFTVAGEVARRLEGK